MEVKFIEKAKQYEDARQPLETEIANLPQILEGQNPFFDDSEDKDAFFRTLLVSLAVDIPTKIEHGVKLMVSLIKRVLNSVHGQI